MSYLSVSGDPNSGRDYEGDGRAYEQAYRFEQENDRRIAAERAARAARAAQSPPHPLATSEFPDPNRTLSFGGRKPRRTKRTKRTKRSRRK